MQSTTFNRPLLKLFTLVVCCFIVSSFTTKLGLDSYEIYLNNKLLLKQSVNQPLSLRKLQLNKTGENDALRIYYRHCHTPNTGTGRSIAVKDEKGRLLKKWNFPNATGSDQGMTIPVKELQQLERTHLRQELSLCYTAQELSGEEALAFLHFK
ncbi:hypothetical protein LQ567_07275 [Niabella pedocola]|uniref:Uncharacterized protein n=1 Tax=Niabella pedocola TaxID=1752077 RepID=A0ABS8PNX1_9BACT|nr:hypothetical protein [Niabella pedocola]MCD2422560.1 hypothetical protein [Niabella pedocola]